MKDDRNINSPASGADLISARDCMDLMLLEYGDVHIETLGQLLRLTNDAEQEYSHICNQRAVT